MKSEMEPDVEKSVPVSEDRETEWNEDIEEP